MSKLSNDEACLICSEIPCICSGRKPNKAQARVKRANQSEPVGRAGVGSMRDRIKAAAAEPPATASQSVQASGKTQPQQPSQLSDNEVVFQQALRNLATLLYPEELKEYRAVITAVPTTQERAIFWKAAREAILDEVS